MKFFIFAIASLSRLSHSLVYQEVLSFKPPLTDDKFEHWDTQVSTVFLKNKIILAPEGKEQNGYIGQKYVSILPF